MNPLSPKTIQIIRLLLIVIAVSLIAYLVVKSDGEPTQTAFNPVCSDEQLVEGNKALEPAQVDNLNKLSTDIQGLKNFDTDPNCLYVVISSYLQVSDAENARKYFELMKENYKEDKLNPIVFVESGREEFLMAIGQRIADLEETHTQNLNQTVVNVEGPEGQ